MDAFFAACEERFNPQFAGKPVVIGADPKAGRGRGVVSTANYPARAYGIRSAMPISRAWQLAECAKKQGKTAVVFLGGNHALYEEVSARIMAILASAADWEGAGAGSAATRKRKFEQASIDEAYLDVTSKGNFREARRLAAALKEKIRAQEGITASVGVGENKLVAKIASDFKKPDGLTVVEPGRAAEFLAPLPVRALPGVGPKTEVELAAKNIRTVGDLRRIPRADLGQWFGKWGTGLFEKARGRSDDPVEAIRAVKSVGAEETFEKDASSAGFVLDRARAISAEVWERLAEEQVRSFRAVVLKVRFADFETLTRACTFKNPASRKEALSEAVLKMLLPFLDARGNPKRKRIRLIGVRAEKLDLDIFR